MPASPLTAFSWGYEGWGRAVPHLVREVDRLERERGFAPPCFVDIRLRRAVRAPGFQGNRFAKTLGSGRYEWMPRLGNRAIGEGGSMRLADPTAIEDLLDLIVERARGRQRVIYFCSCGSPEALSPLCPCHRTLVTRRLAAAARRRGIRLVLDEWSGGAPRLVHVPVPAAQLARLTRQDSPVRGAPDATTTLLTLGPAIDPAPLYSLGHLSLALLSATDAARLVVTGPVVRRARGWCLPVYAAFEPDQFATAQRWATRRRAHLGLVEAPWPTPSRRPSAAPTADAPFALYTIRHPDTLDEMTATRRPVRFSQGRAWRGAAGLLDLARSAGLRMPVLLADATWCTRLTHIATLDQLQLRADRTQLVVSATTRLPRVRSTQQLTLLSNGQHIAPGFIRPYALVAAPSWLRSARAVRRRRR